MQQAAMIPSDTKLQCRTVWISDIHLGSPNCKAHQLLDFLDKVDCEQLYLVGDIIDLLAMKRRVHWPKTHNRVISKLMKLSRRKTQVIYVPGNHDHAFRMLCNTSLGKIDIRKKLIHETADGLRLLVTHGDELDYAVRYSRINRVIGDIAYDALMRVNRWVDRFRSVLGKPHWSLASWVKANVAQAEQAINAYQLAAFDLAEKKSVDGIICGHLHYPTLRRHRNMLYVNDGDWVENCTALIEDHDGKLRLVKALQQNNDKTFTYSDVTDRYTITQQ